MIILWYLNIVVLAHSSFVVEGYELIIIHNGDINGQYDELTRDLNVCYSDDRNAGKCIGGFPRTVTKVNQLRVESLRQIQPLLVLNSGSTLSGSLWSKTFDAQLPARLMNILGPNAVAIGSNDLGNGTRYLNTYIEALASPVVAANVEVYGQSDSSRLIKRSVVHAVAGKLIGIIGFVAKDTLQPTEPESLVFIDEIPAIKVEVANLLSIGVQIIIALGNSGFQMSKEIARQVPEIDIVVGGGEETFLYTGTEPDVEKAEGTYPTIVRQHAKKITPIVHAFTSMKYLGFLRVKFNDVDDPVEASGNPILIDNTIQEDKLALAEIEPKRELVWELSNSTVGFSRVALDGRIRACSRAECNFGNLVGDAYVEYLLRNHTGRNWADTAIALVLCGTINGLTNKTGRLTLGDMISMSPFQNYLSSCSISGETLLRTLEESVAEFGSTVGRGFFQLSGLKVEYDMSKEKYRRVTRARARCSHCPLPVYHDVIMNKTYSVVLSAILLNGTLDQKYIARDHSDRRDLPEIGAFVLREYMKTHHFIYPQIEGRIIVKTAKKSKGSLTFFPSRYSLKFYVIAGIYSIIWF